MRYLRMRVAYDGTDYHGWQQQPGVPTVQGTLVKKLATIVGERAVVDGASRTDSGVHARGQVAAIRTEHRIPAERLEAALNSRLPDDIAVADVREVDAGFEPSVGAVDKHYRYRIYTGREKPVFRHRFVWRWRTELEVAPMVDAARRLVGTRDFKSFESRGSKRADTVRTITRLDVARAGDEIHVDVEGDGFLYKMVRNLVGTLTAVGRGHRPPEWIDEVLAALDRTAAGPCAPPEGLCLMRVRYPEDVAAT